MPNLTTQGYAAVIPLALDALALTAARLRAASVGLEPGRACVIAVAFTGDEAKQIIDAADAAGGR